MAKAPKTRKENEGAERVALTLSRLDASGERVSKTLNMDDLGPADDLVSRKQTGFPVTPFLEQESFGSDSIIVLWWMARRKSGEPDLRFDQVAAEFPNYRSLTEADFQIEAQEEEDEESDPLPSDEG